LKNLIINNESQGSFLEFKTKLNINGAIDVWSFCITTYRHDYCHLANKKAIEKLKMENLQNDKLEVNFLTRKFIENGDFPIFNWKIERNVFDYKNEVSIFVRMDKEFITEKDINEFLTLFVLKRYKAFEDKNKIQMSRSISDSNISFDKFNNFILN
jgi:hypothetical protein